VTSEINGTGNVAAINAMPVLPNLLVSFTEGYKDDMTNAPLKTT
jgi:hypothetical protein